MLSLKLRFGANTPCLPPQISLPDDVKMLVYTSVPRAAQRRNAYGENLLAVIKGALEICEPLETTLVLPFITPMKRVRHSSCNLLSGNGLLMTVLKNVTKNMKLFSAGIHICVAISRIFYSNIKE